MNTTDDKQEEEWPEEDNVVFVPDEVYRDFHSALDRMEQAHEELRKITKKIPQKGATDEP